MVDVFDVTKYNDSQVLLNSFNCSSQLISELGFSISSKFLIIIAVKTIRTSGLVVSVVNEYTLAVKGEIDSSIEWVTNSNLGTIDTDITSELSVVARHLNSTYTIKYNLTNKA